MTSSKYEAASDEITLGLTEGAQTQVTERIQKLADSISGEGLEYLKNVSDYLQRTLTSEATKQKLREDTSFVFPDRLARTADEILEPCPKLKDNRPLITGCTERGKVFRALCLAKGIPAVFVDTLDANYLEAIKSAGKIIEPMRGHVFIDVCVDGEWHTVNPGFNEPILQYSNYSLNGKRQEVIGRGLDSADLGYRSTPEFRSWLQNQLSDKNGPSYESS